MLHISKKRRSIVPIRNRPASSATDRPSASRRTAAVGSRGMRASRAHTFAVPDGMRPTTTSGRPAEITPFNTSFSVPSPPHAMTQSTPAIAASRAIAETPSARVDSTTSTSHVASSDAHAASSDVRSTARRDAGLRMRTARGIERCYRYWLLTITMATVSAGCAQTRHVYHPSSVREVS